jgi:hypothetical protein
MQSEILCVGASRSRYKKKKKIDLTPYLRSQWPILYKFFALKCEQQNAESFFA